MRNIPFMYEVPGKKRFVTLFNVLSSLLWFQSSIPACLHVHSLHCLHLASTNSSLVLVLGQFWTLVCLSAQTPITGVSGYAGISPHNPTELTQWISASHSSPSQPHFTASTLFCGHDEYFHCHPLTNGNIKAQRTKWLASSHTEEHWRDKRKCRISTETCLSHSPRLLYYSTHIPVCSHSYKAAHNS